MERGPQFAFAQGLKICGTFLIIVQFNTIVQFKSESENLKLVFQGMRGMGFTVKHRHYIHTVHTTYTVDISCLFIYFFKVVPIYNLQ